MSYDVSVTVDAGGPNRISTSDQNITYNLSGMFHLALGGDGLNDLGECRDAIPRLITGITDMLARPEAYKELNPPNGWGDYDGALAFLQDLLRHCQAAPLGRVDVS